MTCKEMYYKHNLPMLEYWNSSQCRAEVCFLLSSSQSGISDTESSGSLSLIIQEGHW